MITGSSVYDIARPTGACAATGKPIEVGQRFVAALAMTPGDDSLARLDFSAEAWDGGARPAAPLELFGFWRATVPEPNAVPKPLIDDDELMDLFEQLGEAPGESRLGFRFLLGLILIRKRRLSYEGGRPADAKSGRTGLMLVRPKGVALPPDRGGDGPALIEVIDPGLDDEQIAAATEQLGQIMNLGEPSESQR